MVREDAFVIYVHVSTYRTRILSAYSFLPPSHFIDGSSLPPKAIPCHQHNTEGSIITLVYFPRYVQSESQIYKSCDAIGLRSYDDN
jgi:hypothetical protein